MKTLIKFLLICLWFAFIDISAQVTTVQSGNWSATSTWSSGVVPDSTTDIIISAGDTVTIDVDNAECRNISFGDATANFAMDSSYSRLNIYGDYTIASTTHISFSRWPAGAKIRFVGSADQTLSGWTTSTTEQVGSLVEVEIDKTGGKVTTPGTNIKLTIGTSFDVINGTFELATTDDFVGRTRTGSYTSQPTITVHPNGSFIMLGSTSYIRSGGIVEKPIGKIIVYGNADLASSDTRFVNIDGIDVEDGGVLSIPYYSEGNMGVGRLNADTIIIKNGGRMTHALNTNIWHANTVVALQNGGVYETTSSVPVLPTFIENQGTIRYARSSSTDQTVVDMDYHNIEFRHSTSGAKKNWTLTSDRVITGELTNGYSAETVISGSYKLTVNGTFRITSGSVDNSDPNLTIEMADGSLISRATGTLTDPLTIAGNVDVLYWSTSQSITTGPELPSVVRNITFNVSGQTDTLDKNLQVNGSLTLSSGSFYLDNKSLKMEDGSKIRRATGTLSEAPTFTGIFSVEYISVVGHVTDGYELPNILDTLTITGNKGVTLEKNITVKGAINILGSDLDCPNDTIVMGQNAILTETDTTTVVGNITTTRTVVQSTNNDFGGIGLEINALGAAPGLTTISRTTGLAHTINSDQSIKRYFNVQPMNNSGLNATIIFRYADSELNGLEKDSLGLFKSTNNGTTWDDMGGIRNVASNNVTLEGVDEFSMWTLAKSNLVGIEDNEIGVPKVFSLSQNYPNPFNPTTMIAFTLPEDGFVSLKVYNTIGQEVATIFNGNAIAGKEYNVEFNAIGLASGLYIAKIEFGNKYLVKKMMLLK